MNADRQKEGMPTRRWLAPLLCAAGAGVFLGLAYLLLYHGTDLWQLWLPANANNDVVIYNRQVAGVLAGGGQPEGVFGYNESRAAVGHFGAWGPVLILLYAVPALLVGTGVNMMFWCNVLFVVAGWVIFAVGARLDWRRQLIFAGAAVLAWLPLEQVFTGTAEPVQYFLIFCILGASAALQRRFRVGWYCLLAAACGLITVVRAYTVVLWLFPVALLWKHHRKVALGSIALAVVSLGGYFGVTALCNAPFFAGGDVDYTAISMLAEGQVGQALAYEWQRGIGQVAELWTQYLWPTLTGQGNEQGRGALVLGVLLAVTLGCTLYDRARRRPVAMKVCALVCVVISLAGLFGLYSLTPFARHSIMLFILLLGALLCEDLLPALVCLPVLALLLPFTMATPTLPTYDAAMDAQLQVVAQALEQRDEAQQSDDPWAHTLAYAFRDDVFHGYLYAVPAGMGIQFDRNTYLADENNPIHAQYVMVEHGGDAEARLLADGWTELVSTQALVVYERPGEV